MDSRSACRLLVGSATTLRYCARRPLTKPQRRGGTSGHPCWPRWGCSRVIQQIAARKSPAPRARRHDARRTNPTPFHYDLSGEPRRRCRSCAGQDRYTEARRMEVLELNGAVGRDTERRQHGIAIAAFKPGAVALPDEV